MSYTNTIIYEPPFLCSIDWSHASSATVAVRGFQIILWMRAQKKTPSEFEVLKYHNFGIALLIWLVYAIIVFSKFWKTQCSIHFSTNDLYRWNIATHLLHWIAMDLTLTTVLFTIPSGLDRLRDPADKHSSSTWTLASRAAMALVSVFTTIYLGLFTWAFQSVIDSSNDPSLWDCDAGQTSAFPQYTYVNMALTICWYLALLAAVARTALGFRAGAERCRERAPASLRACAWTLCGAVVAWGFLMTLFAFYGPWSDFSYASLVAMLTYPSLGEDSAARSLESFESIDAYFALSIAELVLVTFFSLLTLLAVARVAKGVSGMLAHPDLYGFGRREGGTVEYAEV